MPDTPEEDQPISDAAPVEDATPAAQTRTHAAEPWRPQPTWPRWLVPLSLLLALVAVGLSIWALTTASSNASNAAKLPGDPKTRVCTAFDTVSNAVSINTHADLGPDPVALTAVAGNARLALIGGGQYLLTQIDSATPNNLADPVRSFAYDLQDIGIYALAGQQTTTPEQTQRTTRADVTRKQIVDLCK
jgi:hypothetical protein